MLEIDHLGLEAPDRLLLETMITRFGGGPVGLNSLAAATNETPDAIETLYEPFLVWLGLIQITPRGRMATDRAYQHLGIAS